MPGGDCGKILMPPTTIDSDSQSGTHATNTVVHFYPNLLKFYPYKINLLPSGNPFPYLSSLIKAGEFFFFFDQNNLGIDFKGERVSKGFGKGFFRGFEPVKS